MWMGQRRASLATVIDDGLGVANVVRRCMLDKAIPEHCHHVGASFVCERVDAIDVARGEDEHLMCATGFGHHMDRPEVAHCERVLAVEGGEEIGDHAHPPVVIGSDGLERGQG